MRSGTRATAACACTRSSRGRGSRSGCPSASRRSGYWSTEDGGQTWKRTTTGIVPPYVPGGSGRDHERHLRAQPASGAASARAVVHAVPRRRLPQRRRRDSRGPRIADGLPSGFGFPIVGDPADPDNAYVIPMVADVDRVTVDGAVRVYETRDAGEIVDRARRRSPVEGLLPHDPAPGVRPRRRGRRAGPVVRGHQRRGLRQRRRGPFLVHGGAAARARSRASASRSRALVLGGVARLLEEFVRGIGDLDPHRVPAPHHRRQPDAREETQHRVGRQLPSPRIRAGARGGRGVAVAALDRGIALILSPIERLDDRGQDPPGPPGAASSRSPPAPRPGRHADSGPGAGQVPP